MNSLFQEAHHRNGSLKSAGLANMRLTGTFRLSQGLLNDQNRKALTEEEFGALVRAERAVWPNPPPPPERQQAIIEILRGTTFVWSCAVYGIASTDPYGYHTLHDRTLNDLEFGREVHAALDASRFTRPGDPDWAWFEKYPNQAERDAQEVEIRSHLGVKTRKATYAGGFHFDVHRKKGDLEIYALHHGASGDWEKIQGYTPMIAPDSLSAEELGAR